MITGNTKNEGAAFAPFSLNQTTSPDPEAIKMSDSMFICGVDAEAKYYCLYVPSTSSTNIVCSARASHNLTTYRYLFSGNFSNITPRYWLGAMHSCTSPPLTHIFSADERQRNYHSFSVHTTYSAETPPSWSFRRVMLWKVRTSPYLSV
jgi:hypothetical protein